MESSRIFIKNLPPAGLSEADLRKHFSARGQDITDIRLIPRKRIGYIGYKTPQDAVDAVNYFNRSYIRMSRLNVELARPVADPSLPNARRRKQINYQRLDTNDASRDTKTVATKVDPTPPTVSENAKKRKREDLDESDPKLQEFLETMRPGYKAARTKDTTAVGNEEADMPMIQAEDPSDDEYESIPKREAKRRASIDQKQDAKQPSQTSISEATVPVVPEDPLAADGGVELRNQHNGGATTDDDWLRVRTNRLLDLMDPGDLATGVDSAQEATRTQVPSPEDPPGEAADDNGTPAQAQETSAPAEADLDAEIEEVQRTSRLFIRNLPYSASEDDVREFFRSFGAVEEVHLPVSSSGTSKGFAFVLYESPSSAVAAFQNADGKTFQGRLLHVLPAAAKKENKLDDVAISKLPLKKQNLIRKKAEAASNSFNWNSLFMNPDAVMASTAQRLHVSKAELLDPTSSDAAVKQAIAETSVIQEAKEYFAASGVNLDAFKTNKRGGASILVKNFPFPTSSEELRRLFEDHGTVLRVLMPPSGTIAIVQFAQPAQAKVALTKLAYRRFRDSVLKLEPGPKDLFADQPLGITKLPTEQAPAAVQKVVSSTELLEKEDEVETSSVFVRNLNFATTTAELAEAFQNLDGFVSAQVKTKADPKKPGQVLSMGFGFCHFRTKDQAKAAVEAMDGFALHAHTLSVKASHKGTDAAEERKREELAKKAVGRGTKIVIKNLPFEASKKDVRALFGNYGQLKGVRIPQKFGGSRGFAFADFASRKDAENALNALRNTHLLGRRLVLDFAEAEALDAEEEIAKMSKKIGGQVNKITLRQLTGRGRTKVNIGSKEEDG